MKETRSIRELPRRGKASARRLDDGRVQLQATHALAVLYLIEDEAGLDIRVTSGEQQVLLDWPLRSFSYTLEHDDPQAWALAAGAILRAGPPPRRLLPWLLLLAVFIFTLTFALLQTLYGLD